VYGLPERHRKELAGARLVATPGCYVTAATLALAPLLEAGLVERTGLIVDAASGVSGAGRAAKADTTFCAVDENFTAYGLLDHRHTPEIEQNLDACGSRASLGASDQGCSVLFTPHLAPMNRGILATCYARPAAGAELSTGAVLAALRNAYAAEPFVVVVDGSPGTKATLGSNAAHVTARYDERTGTIVAIAALDNLTKGASGGALQAANLALGLDERLGLPLVGVAP
jgi:N-acetyl-gamma-glutamyl-phosphate reductase